MENARGSARKTDIRGFSADSRKMEKDFAFVALKGERDGCDFAESAVENGASAVIADRPLDLPVPVLVVKDALKAFQSIAKFHRLRFENPVVGITGSCGKTSTKEMLARLVAWKNPLVTEKNFNNEIGVPLTVTKIDLRQNQCAIVEAGVAAPGQMRELAEIISPDIAIITNVGLSHLEKFGEIANVAKEKAILPANAANGGWCLMHSNLLSWKSFDELKCKKAIVAKADAPDIKADLVFRYALSENGESVGVDMCVEGGAEYFFEIGKMTQGMTENAMLAIAAALMLGAREEQIAAAAETFAPLPMRGLWRRSRRKPLLRRLLQRLSHFDEGRSRALPENFRRQRTAPFPARLHGGTGARRAPPPQGNRLQPALPRGRQGGARRRKRRNLQARNGRIPVAGRRDRNLCGFRLRKRFRGRLQGLGIRQGQAACASSKNALPAAALAALDSEGARRIEPEPEPEEPEPPEEDDDAGADEFEDAEDFEDGEDSDVESADGNEDDEDERETI